MHAVVMTSYLHNIDKIIMDCHSYTPQTMARSSLASPLERFLHNCLHVKDYKVVKIIDDNAKLPKVAEAPSSSSHTAPSARIKRKVSRNTKEDRWGDLVNDEPPVQKPLSPILRGRGTVSMLERQDSLDRYFLKHSVTNTKPKTTATTTNGSPKALITLPEDESLHEEEDDFYPLKKEVDNHDKRKAKKHHTKQQKKKKHLKSRKDKASSTARAA